MYLFPLGSIDVDVMKDYLQQYGPVTTGLEDRIVILGDPSCYYVKNIGLQKYIILCSLNYILSFFIILVSI